MTTTKVVYHGNKTTLLRYIMPLIEQAPEYTIYVEPFVGGGTVFFNLQHINKKGYILNDISNQVVNFYQVAKTYPDELITRIQAMPRSYTLWVKARDELKKAKIIPNLSIDHAVYFYYLYPFSYGIRKLTPRECLNFQGFPTIFVLPEIPDTHLYKQIGNSVSVPVVARIVKQIKKAM